RKGSTIEDVAHKLHRDFVKNFKYAKVWGKSVKFPGQKVGLEHVLEDHDIVRIIIKK
ncbi:MAG: TGS domain-containing protein, partial [Methanosphaera sp.]|nr:TGS domain-containing protein [Methanosphaera sp.]